jgi:hypothetical protein
VVPLPIARRANYPIRCSVKGSEQIDTVFRVADRSKEVSETRYRECNNLYTKDSTECKYSAAGRLGSPLRSDGREVKNPHTSLA